ncbi:MAG: tetratricopeptide repeat protein [Pirellulaceae bacterium]|nr:tetratricopeptide repeat protein [Pirellulaceae bacterium]
MKVLLGGIPCVALVLLALTVWIGGRLDKDTLVNRYLELGRTEIGDWEARLIDSFSIKPQEADQADKSPTGDKSNAATAAMESVDLNSDQPQADGSSPVAIDTSRASIDATPSSAGKTTNVAPAKDQIEQDDQADLAGSNDQTDSTEMQKYVVSPYGEMLYKRAQLLRPTPESQFVVGTTLMQRGNIVQGQKVLRSLAPDDKAGLPKAHAIMAMGYMAQYAKNPNNDLVPVLLHHAQESLPWEYTPKEVLFVASDINWQKRDFDRSLQIFETLTQRFPEHYHLLAQRARAAKRDELADNAIKHAIEYYKNELAKEPSNHGIRIQIVQLLGASPEALDEGEELLNQAPEDDSYNVIRRAKSDLYRVRFGNFLRPLLEQRLMGKTVEQIKAMDRLTVDLSLLERALEIDPTNPLVSEQTAILIRDKINRSPKLTAALKEMLDSDTASVGTHAVLSEHFLNEGRYADAIRHLEKVHKAAPLAVKYANNLAWLYLEEKRIDEAMEVGKRTLELLQQNGLQGAQFIDELLDTLGMVYQAQGKDTDAISLFELALRYNPNRTDSRERLAALYRKRGNEGVAVAHEQAIEAIKKAQMEAEENAKQAASQSVAAAPSDASPDTPSQDDSAPSQDDSAPSQDDSTEESASETSADVP